MKTITDLKPQVKNSKRVSVFLDGHYTLGLDLITCMQLRLKVGDTVEESELVKAQILSETNLAFDIALNKLSKSYKTTKEIIKVLKDKGFVDEIIEKVIEKLVNYKYLDDTEYAKRYVATYSKSCGKKMLKYKLMQKGISESIIDSVLTDDLSCEETAYKIAEKYLKNKELNKQNILKCYKYLLSKGFSYDEAKVVVDKFNID